jgi:hypothetical protein
MKEDKKDGIILGNDNLANKRFHIILSGSKASNR